MKTETIEEYLARGGTVERLEYVKPIIKTMIKVNGSTGRIMSLDEGAHFFSEFKSRSIKHKRVDRLNVKLIPKTLIDSLKEVGIDLEDL